MKKKTPKSLRPRGYRWSLHLCCNDPDNGMPQGFIVGAQFGAGRGNYTYGTDWLDVYRLHLSGCEVEVPFGWVDDTHFRLGEQVFECCGRQNSIGNWCWDGCFITKQTLRQVAPILKAGGLSPDEGSEWLWRWWENVFVPPVEQRGSLFAAASQPVPVKPRGWMGDRSGNPYGPFED